MVGFCALIVSWVIAILGMVLTWRSNKGDGIGIDLRQYTLQISIPIVVVSILVYVVIAVHRGR